MKRIFVLVMMIFATLAGHAEAFKTLVQSKNSDLKLVELRKKDELFAKFSGYVWVTGTLYGRWPAGAGALSYAAPEYTFVTDNASKLSLPHFLVKDPPYVSRYKVESIEIENGEDAVRLALGNAAALRLLDRRTDSIRATGRFQLQSFEMGVECDATWAKAKITRVEIPEKVAAHQKPWEGC